MLFTKTHATLCLLLENCYVAFRPPSRFRPVSALPTSKLSPLAFAVASCLLCAGNTLAQTDTKPNSKVNASGLPWFNYNPNIDGTKFEKFPLGATFKGREETKKPFATVITEAHIPNMVMLKFKDGIRVAYDGKQFNLSEKSLPSADLRRGMAKLNDAAKRDASRQIESLLFGFGDIKIIPLVTKPQTEHDAELARLDNYSPVPLADMSTYFTVVLPEKLGREATMSAINALNANDAVELAAPISIPSVPSLPAKNAPREQSLVFSSTPDFSYLPTYLQPVEYFPNGTPSNYRGIGATYAWNFAGGKGEGTKFIDVEFDWNLNHEDLKPTGVANSGILGQTGGAPGVGRGYRYHGTGVVGTLIGQHNGFGVKGIIPAAQWGYTSVYQGYPSMLVNTLTYGILSGLSRGDAILMELSLSPAQNVFWPVESDSVVYNAIQVASANGLIVIEPAGNGAQNIDGVIPGQTSGAIMIGARNQTNAQPSYFTNFGSRVDLFGQGENVVTTSVSRTPGNFGNVYCSVNGVSTLPGANPFSANEFVWPPASAAASPSSEDVCYTQRFDGTSSAAPIVMGALLSLQGIHKNTFPINNSSAVPNFVRPQPLLNIFKKTGYAQTSDVAGKPIGKGPNLETAISHYFADYDADSHSNGKEAAMGWVRTYRLYSPTTYRHFFTQDENERNILRDVYGWTCEGLGYKLFATPDLYTGNSYAGTGVQLFRLLNPNTNKHLLTSSVVEKNNLIAGGWIYEGVMGFVSPTPATNLVPLYRIYFPGTFYHFFTTDAFEKNYWIGVGAAIDDGIVGYVVPINAATNGPNQCKF